MHVAGNKQVETAVAVIIAKGRARRPVAESYSSFFGDVGEGSIVIIVVEAILAEVRHVEIGPAIIVIIADCNAESPAVVRDASLLSNVRKSAVMIVVKERGVRRQSLARYGVISGAVHHVDVEPAVVIVIEQRNAGAYGL